MATREIPMAKVKPARQNSANAITNVPAQSVPNVAQQKTDTNEEYKPKFLQEFSDIMRGYGDCERPLRDSVILVEKIVIQQMRSILNDAINLAIERKGLPEPSQKDFEHLMRKNPVKIFRLQKHIKYLEFRRRYNEMRTGKVTALAEDLDADKSDEESMAEMAEKYDEEKVRRLFRADRVSLTLNGTQYTQFNESRKVSFHCRNSVHIRDKLHDLLKPPPEAKISMHVYTILGFLVHETIATIVDYAILTRLNSNNRTVDPFSRITSSGELAINFSHKQ